MLTGWGHGRRLGAVDGWMVVAAVRKGGEREEGGKK